MVSKPVIYTNTTNIIPDYIFLYILIYYSFGIYIYIIHNMKIINNTYIIRIINDFQLNYYTEIHTHI